MENFYKQALKESPVGYAYHKIHLNNNGVPCDYEFIEVNDAFVTYTGLKSTDIIGKKVTEILPGITDSNFDWIKTYGDIAINGGTIEFEQFSDPLQRSYKVKAYSNEPNYFITQFTESTKDTIWANDLKIILEMSDELLQLEKGKDINYQNITEGLKKVSGAKYIVFNLYEDDGKHYHTAAIAGDKGSIKKAEGLVGFDFSKRRWEPNSVITAKAKAFTVTKFDGLETFAGDTIPKPIIHSIEKIFKLGEVVFIRIEKGDIVLGDFQLYMEKGEVFDKTRIVEIFAKQFGNAIERTRAERSLLEVEQCYRYLFEYSDTGIAFYDPEGTVISYNQKAANNMGGNPEDYVGKSIFDLFPKADAKHYMNRMKQALKSNKQEEYIDYIELPTGNKWFHSKYNRIRALDGNAAGVQIISQDITEQKKAEDDLKESENQFRRAVEAAPVPIMLHAEDGEVLRISQTWSEITGYKLSDIPTTEHWADKAYGQKKDIVKAVIDNVYNLSERQYDGEYEINTKDDQIRNWDFYSSHIGILEDGRKIAMSVAIDTTERKRSQEQILRLSYHDQLTGLYNRRFYEEELRRLDVKRNLPIALIMADVNGLKITNDAFGHQEGDKLLRMIANIFRTKCRSDEIVSRIGGDEFVILLPKTDAKEACRLIDRIMEAVTKEAEKNGTVSMSIGYAVKSNSEESMDDVFKNAEDDMYRHKLSESSSMRSKSIDLIMNSLYEKSNREMLHSKRVSSISEQIAEQMYFPKENIRQIVLAGLMHDIGKIGISNEILDKEGALTTDEFMEVKKHSEAGYRILSSVSEFSNISQYVLSHHERWDGKGYPQGIMGNAIPIQARIIAIADAYDAMTSDRTYRNKMSEDEAIIEINRCSGAQFDPDIVKIFTENVMKKN